MIYTFIQNPHYTTLPQYLNAHTIIFHMINTFHARHASQYLHVTELVPNTYTLLYAYTTNTLG